MHKLFLPLCFFLFFGKLVAQPQFTAGNCFQLNDSARLGFVLVNQPFDGFISQTGSNFIWDFSGTGFPGPWGTWTSPTIPYVFQPSALSTHVPFQTTQINEYSNLAGARDHFYSYSPDQDTLYFYGYYAGSNFNYYTPIPYLNFPLNYNDSVFTRTVQQVGTTTVGSVTRYWKYDGYGTVKFPYGNQSDVFRIRTKQIDSSVVNGTFISAVGSEEIIWFRLSDGIPLLRFVKQGPANITAYHASVNAPNSLRHDHGLGSLRVFPNPAGASIQIISDASFAGTPFTISDALGKTVLRGRLNSGITPVDVGSFFKGQYHLRLDNENKPSVSFLKQ